MTSQEVKNLIAVLRKKGVDITEEDIIEVNA